MTNANLVNKSPDLSNLNIDSTWCIQGRILPPSCTKGAGCLLHLQVKEKNWPSEHFHIGQSKVPPEMGVELTTALLMPTEETLIGCSFDLEEQSQEIEYLYMVKLKNPHDTIGFLTTNGLVFLVQIEGLEEMFTKTDKCQYCTGLPIQAYGYQGNLDELLLMVKDETNH